MTEILSFFKALNLFSLSICWFFIILILLVLYYKKTKKFLPDLAFFLPRLSKIEFLLLIMTGLICSVTLFLALWTPPNTWDSMTYHMPRVMHWIQNRTVAFYPTAEIRQLWSNPFAEYMIAHFQLLTGSDRFANMPQWMAMFFSLITVSLIARHLGAKRHAQILASFIAATVPMGILQSTSTQNDYVAGCYVVIAAFYLLKSIHEPIRKYFLLAGIACGLAALAKGTAYVFLLPFGLTAIVFLLKKSWKTGIRALLIIFAAALIINAPHFIRNYKLGGHPISPVQNATYLKNQHFAPNALLSNLIRNIGINIATPSEKLDEQINQAVAAFHQLIRADLTDKRTTFGEYPFKVTTLIRHEDHAPNPIHLLLILIAVGLLPFQMKRHQKAAQYFLLCLCGFLLFSALLKWQPWGTRIQLPFFILTAPALAILLGQSVNWFGLLAITLPLFIYAMPITFQNSSKKIISSRNSVLSLPRTDQYFTNNPALKAALEHLCDFIIKNQYKNIGLAIGGESWEYPIWVLLNPRQNNIRIEHVTLTDKSPTSYLNGPFDPDILVSFQGQPTFTITLQNTVYPKIKQWGEFSLFSIDTSLANRDRILRDVFFSTVQHASSPVILPEKKDFPRFIRDLSFALDCARAINPAELNQKMRGLGDSYQNVLLKGLELRITGFLRGNQSLFNQGQSLIQNWLNDFRRQESVVREALSAE